MIATDRNPARRQWFAEMSRGADQLHRLKIRGRRQRRAARQAIHNANHQRRLRARQLTSMFRK